MTIKRCKDCRFFVRSENFQDHTSDKCLRDYVIDWERSPASQKYIDYVEGIEVTPELRIKNWYTSGGESA